ncbi:Uncharacterized protein APZ42_027361 [Daphnia magna]|uniref:Uncharacterized protein n=1 Tax=Daphnia magna TaxID=35525 RepID=A0A164RHM8_9CRUS|nr:Uncharacterized protein APZ42_027361 [Daphnia magna]
MDTGQFCRKSKRFPRLYGELATRPDPIGNFLNGVWAPSFIRLLHKKRIKKKKVLLQLLAPKRNQTSSN